MGDIVERLDAIEARLKAADFPKWTIADLERAFLDSVYRRLDHGYKSPFDGYTLPISVLLGNAPADLAFLLAEVRRLRKKYIDAACFQAAELLERAESAERARDEALRRVTPVLDYYDAGLLGDGGGGDVQWWHDYIRAELARAHEFYQSQLAPSPVST